MTAERQEALETALKNLIRFVNAAADGFLESGYDGVAKTLREITRDANEVLVKDGSP